MNKNPWVFLVVGLMIGLIIGYVVADRQARSEMVSLAPPSSTGTAAAPPAPRPPRADSAPSSAVHQELSAIDALLADDPGNGRLLVARGNILFDAHRWEEARVTYEEALQAIGTDADVETDLAVVYRNLKQPERALEILEGVLQRDPKHWQAVYNRVIILHFDLHRHDEAVKAFDGLEALANENPSIPDLSGLATEVRGG